MKKIVTIMLISLILTSCVESKEFSIGKTYVTTKDNSEARAKWVSENAKFIISSQKLSCTKIDDLYYRLTKSSLKIMPDFKNNVPALIIKNSNGISKISFDELNKEQKIIYNNLFREKNVKEHVK